MCKKQQAGYWPAEEVDLSQDEKDWTRLSENEQFFLKNVLAFFASSDGIVLENLALRFLTEVQIPEVRYFYGMQITQENIHSEMYGLLIDTYIKDADEKQKLFQAILTISCITKKADWALKWIKSDTASFAERLVCNLFSS
jgi:ribonucleotide reductase beta subunit family protein with ferritin-like domain